MDANPYQPPGAEMAGAVAAPASNLYPASAVQRFGNFVIDQIAAQAGGGLLLGLVEGFWGVEIFGRVPDQLLGVALMSAYYILTEGMTGRTLGKLVTRTRVVNAGHGEVPLGRVVLRTLSRFVPFEMLSLYFNDGVPWHDSWSGTRVMTTRAPKYLTEA